MIRIALASAALAGALASAPAARAGLFEGVPVDGPSPDILALGGVAIAPDGDGGAVELRVHDGMAHVDLLRLRDGAWLAPVRVDAGLAGASSAPVIAAGNDGALVIAFENGGTVHAAWIDPGGKRPHAPRPLIPGRDPAVGMSPFGIAYVAAGGGGDVRAARLRAGRWDAFAAPLDRDPTQDAGSGGGRPRVAVSADGSAVVAWGEGGAVLARRLTKDAIGGVVAQASPAAVDGVAVSSAELPAVAVQDDSSFAPVAFVAHLADGHDVAMAAELRGSAFDDPVALVRDADPAAGIAIALSGRGNGAAAIAARDGSLLAVPLASASFGTPVPAGGAQGVVPVPAVAVGTDDAGVLAWQGPGGAVLWRELARSPLLASDPATAVAGADARDGLGAGADASGNAAVLAIQRGPEGARVVAALRDQRPRPAHARPPDQWVRTRRPVLRVVGGTDTWGITAFVAEIDGRPAAEARGRRIALRAPLADGTHRFRALVRDRRGQIAGGRVRRLRVDATRPTLAVVPRVHGHRLRLRITAADATSGLARLSVALGGRAAVAIAPHSTTVVLRLPRARHGHRRIAVAVRAADRAGNARVTRLTIRLAH